MSKHYHSYGQWMQANTPAEMKRNKRTKRKRQLANKSRRINRNKK